MTVYSTSRYFNSPQLPCFSASLGSLRLGRLLLCGLLPLDRQKHFLLACGGLAGLLALSGRPRPPHRQKEKASQGDCRAERDASAGGGQTGGSKENGKAGAFYRAAQVRVVELSEARLTFAMASGESQRRDCS